MKKLKDAFNYLVTYHTLTMGTMMGTIALMDMGETAWAKYGLIVSVGLAERYAREYGKENKKKCASSCACPRNLP